MAGVAASARPSRISCREERAHALAHEKNRSSLVGLAQGGDEGRDVAHLRLKIQRRPTPRGDVVAALPAQVESVECIAWNPRRERMKLLSGAIHSVDTSDRRSAVCCRPRMRAAGLLVMRGP